MTEQDDSPTVESGVLADSELPGRILREEREARSLSIRQAASELHVDSLLLDALEHDDFERIGAPIFVKGHLRNYARLLGLDPKPLVDAYEQMAAGDPPEIVTRQTDGTPMEVNGGGPWLKVIGWILLVLLLLGSIGWWYYQQESASIGTPASLRVLGTESPATRDIGKEEPATASGDDTSAEPQASDPRARLVESGDDGHVDGENAGEAMDEQDVTDAGTVDATESTSQTTPGATESTGSASRPVTGEDASGRRVAETPQVTSSGTPAAGSARNGQQPVSGGEQGTLLLRFSDASWVEVYNAAEEALLYDLVPAGSTRQVSASGELRVFLGNAPAVSIEINGEPFDVQPYVRRDSTARFRIDPSATE